MRNVIWWIKGHLIWKRGYVWNDHLSRFGIHCDACPDNRYYSAYDFWKNYSPINGG